MSTPTPHSTPTHADPTLYLYTSLTAGSSQIITATSRLRTILSAHRIPHVALDVATDDKARMLWGRRSGGKKLPGLVRKGLVLADLETVEEWNEYGELRENLVGAAGGGGEEGMGTPTKAGAAPKGDAGMGVTAKATTTAPRTGDSAEAPATETKQKPATEGSLTSAMRQMGLEAAKKAGDAKSKARTEALDAAKAKSGRENQTPTGTPPSSATMKATEANKGKQVSGTDDINDGKNTTSTEEGEKKESSEVDEGSEIVEDETPAPAEEEPATVPPSQEAEAAANKAIRSDKSHVVPKGHGRTPEGNTPQNEKKEVNTGSQSKLGMKNAISASEEGEAPAGLGERTQAQGAGRGESVVESVGD